MLKHHSILEGKRSYCQSGAWWLGGSRCVSSLCGKFERTTHSVFATQWEDRVGRVWEGRKFLSTSGYLVSLRTGLHKVHYQRQRSHAITRGALLPWQGVLL